MKRPNRGAPVVLAVLAGPLEPEVDAATLRAALAPDAAKADRLLVLEPPRAGPLTPWLERAALAPNIELLRPRLPLLTVATPWALRTVCGLLRDYLDDFEITGFDLWLSASFNPRLIAALVRRLRPTACLGPGVSRRQPYRNHVGAAAAANAKQTLPRFMPGDAYGVSAAR